MGGFTRPRDLRCSNWFPGGEYARKKIYEKPLVEAYAPHTVFLLESRHFVRHDKGKPESLVHIVGVCRERDFNAIMRKFNSKTSVGDARRSMDNARWPWMRSPSKIAKVKWWDPGENPEEVIRAILDAEDKTDMHESHPEQEHPPNSESDVQRQTQQDDIVEAGSHLMINTT